MLFQIEQNRSTLENDKVVALAVDEDWDSPVRVQLDEPGLFLGVFGEVYVLDAGLDCQKLVAGVWTALLVVERGTVDGFELIKEDTDFAAVGSTSCVQEKRLGHVARGG